MDLNLITATQSGILDIQTLFYTIGGTLLVIFAAMWGFKKIVALLSPEWEKRGYSSASDMSQSQAYFADKHDSFDSSDPPDWSEEDIEAYNEYQSRYSE